MAPGPGWCAVNLKEHRVTVSAEVYEKLRSRQLTWWPQTSVDDEQIQRGDTIVFQQAGPRRPDSPAPLRMVATDTQIITMALPVAGGDRTADVFVARIVALNPASEGSG